MSVSFQPRPAYKGYRVFVDEITTLSLVHVFAVIGH